MSKERLVLVTELPPERAAGMMVVVKNCRQCGRRHRGMLLNYFVANAPGKPWNGEHRWRITAPCPGFPSGFCNVGEDTVSGRRLFREVDEELESETLTTKRTEPASC